MSRGQAAAIRRIEELIEGNGFALETTRRRQTIDLEETLRLREERRVLLALLRTSGGDTDKFHEAVS